MPRKNIKNAAKKTSKPTKTISAREYASIMMLDANWREADRYLRDNYSMGLDTLARLILGDRIEMPAMFGGGK